MSKISDFVIWGIWDIACRDCGRFIWLVAKTDVTEKPQDVVLVCSSGTHIRGSETFSSPELKLVIERMQFSLDGQGRLGVNFQGFDSAAPTIVTVHSTDESSIAVPDGYSAVGWVKLIEAQAVVEAFERKASVDSLNAQGNGFRAVYLPSTDSDAQRFHSQVKVERISRGAVKKAFWPREEEARALIEAHQTHSDITFAHISFGKGGLIQYFPPDHPAALRYYSQTRLLRRR